MSTSAAQLPSGLVILLVAAICRFPSTPALAQSLTVTIGTNQQVSRTVSFDTSLSLAGSNLFIPGALNSAPVIPVSTVNTAQLSYSSGDTQVVIRGSLADVATLAPKTVVRHTGGEGLLHMRSSAEPGPISFGFAMAVPAVTGLGASQSVTFGTSLSLSSFTVFP